MTILNIILLPKFENVVAILYFFLKEESNAYLNIGCNGWMGGCVGELDLMQGKAVSRQL